MTAMNEMPLNDAVHTPDQPSKIPTAPTPKTEAPSELRFRWVTRVGLAFTGIILPLICFWMAATGANPFDIDWQDGRTRTYAGLLVSGPAMGPFFPMLLCSMAGMGLLLWRPTHYARFVWVRLAIYSGVLLAAQYCGILSVTSGIASGAFVVLFIICLIATGILWGFVAFSVWCFRSGNYTIQRIYGTFLGLLFLLSLFVYPVYIIVPLIFATPWALAAYLHMSIRLLRHGSGPRWRFSLARCLGVMTWLAVWFAAWRLSVMLMLEKYMALPTHPPQNCYVATAAACGHARFVGSTMVAGHDGSRVAVNAQLRYLKAAELMLLCAAPRLHRQMRSIYDAVGPRIAARLSHPLLADAAYISLKPAEWGARVFVWFLLPKTCRQWLRGNGVLR
ncbi:MAG: hypothetical protein K8T91_11610 [Planctomycetes bacterium]|nr:hypothetical protein [Planctomycetota bacterium]